MPLSRYDKHLGKPGAAKKTLSSMIERYGEKRGKQVFYATVNTRKNERRARRRS